MISVIKNNVAIIPIRDAEKIGHIIVPEMAKDRVDQGVIKYVGPDCTFATIGAFVTFSGYSGTLINIADPERPNDEGETLIIMSEDFLLAEILDPENTDVPGLYFYGGDGEYFPATYEQSMTLIARALQEAPWRQRLIVKPVVKGEDERQYAYLSKSE
jgi:hypothetical protein